MDRLSKGRTAFFAAPKADEFVASRRHRQRRRVRVATEAGLAVLVGLVARQISALGGLRPSPSLRAITGFDLRRSMSLPNLMSAFVKPPIATE